MRNIKFIFMHYHLNETKFIQFNFNGVQICAEYFFTRDNTTAELPGEKKVLLSVRYTGVSSDPISFKVSKPYSILSQPKETVYSLIKREIMKLHSNKILPGDENYY
jgi:hypothetical protein